MLKHLTLACRRVVTYLGIVGLLISTGIQALLATTAHPVTG